jgi:hypothetical protein
MVFVLATGAIMAALTWLLGWWGVLLAASLVGYVHFRAGGGGWRLALAAAAAWGGLLAADAAAGSFGAVARTLAGVVRAPAAVLVLLTLAFPALLAWGAATFVAGARELLVDRRR